MTLTRVADVFFESPAAPRVNRGHGVGRLRSAEKEKQGFINLFSHIQVDYNIGDQEEHERWATLETGSKIASDEEVMEEAESAWEEEMVSRNWLLAKVNVGVPSEEKMAVERFQDKVAAVAELEKRRVASPRTFFSKTGHWSDMELVGAIQQGLWEVRSFD